MSKKTEKIHIIRKDAKINVVFTSGMVVRLQQLQAYMVNGLSDEQINLFNAELKHHAYVVKNDTQFTQEWMSHFITLSLLMHDIQSYAKEQGMTNEIEQESYLKDTLFNLIEEDNLFDDQSQSQPE
jgi:hypothetical protein